jgi:integrase/recombinase XerD
MTQKRIALNNDILPVFFQEPADHSLEPPFRPIFLHRANSKPKSLYERDYRRNEENRRAFELALKRVSQKDLIGKDHIESYLRDQYRRTLRPRTITNSLYSIESFISFIRKEGKDCIEDITRHDIEEWIEHEQDRGMKASTVDTRLGTLKAFLRFLIERHVLDPDLLSKKMSIRVPDALPRAIDPDDIKQLLSVIDHIRDRAIILVLLRTGMRVGELLNTVVDDVNLKERRIEIYEADKTRVGRVVYLSDDAMKALKAWLKIRKPNKSYLFYSQRKHLDGIKYTAVRNIFVKYLKRADLLHKGYTLHCLRHTCASELLNAGMRLECVQQLLGHSTIEMTRRYARLTDRTREEEYFKAMAVIERGEINGHYQLDSELSTFFEEKKLFSSHY